MVSMKFISAGREYSTLEKRVPAPYLRKAFFIEGKAREAKLTVCAPGFYELYVNGRKITKGLLAPYISNPDDILCYDEYDVASLLREGENVIGLHLGNGMLNSPGGQVWEFEQARYRSAVKAALHFAASTGQGDLQFEADESFLCHASPVLYDDLRAGEMYDARQEIPGWSEPGFDARGWTNALCVETPRGEARKCAAEPIVISREIAPVGLRRARIGRWPEVRPELPQVPMEGVEAQREGWLYDFGVNTAGLCRLRIHGRPGQKIVLQFGETLDENGDLDLRGMSFLPNALNHRDIYICRGEGEEIYTPSFTYHGFQYCLALGLEEEQAAPETLTLVEMHSDLPSRGSFVCSDDVLNRLQECTRISDLANFFYFPTDCPHREKNGWTADAALSAEQVLMNFGAENSYREWLHHIRRAQREDGALPGIIPTAGWGFQWGNGPAWDCVCVYLPYFIWKYRGETDVVRENAAMILRYLHYVTTRRDEDGLIAIGLGDWCNSARRGSGSPKAPLVVTDTLMCMDISAKAETLFRAVDMRAQADFARQVYGQFRAAARERLLDKGSMRVLGDCQTAQAMGVFYDLFDEAEKPRAVEILVGMLHENGDLMDVGVLGGRVLFRVLSQYGYASLAYRVMTTDRYPSYGNWIARGATSLWESFMPQGENPDSHNHHFWGDISGWMMSELGGIHVNPYDRDPAEVLLRPRMIPELRFARAEHETPWGKVAVCWERKGEDMEMRIELAQGLRGWITLDEEWQFEDGCRAKKAASGVYRLISQRQKDLCYAAQK